MCTQTHTHICIRSKRTVQYCSGRLQKLLFFMSLRTALLWKLCELDTGNGHNGHQKWPAYGDVYRLLVWFNKWCANTVLHVHSSSPDNKCITKLPHTASSYKVQIKYLYENSILLIILIKQSRKHNSEVSYSHV